jgi:hypothetical protein
MFTVRSERVSLVEVKLPAGTDPQLAVRRFAALPSVAWAPPNYISQGDPRAFPPNWPTCTGCRRSRRSRRSTGNSRRTR